MCSPTPATPLRRPRNWADHRLVSEGHDGSALRRHRARSCALTQAGAHDGRRCDCGERIGQGVSVYGAPAEQRRDALIQGSDEVSDSPCWRRYSRISSLPNGRASRTNRRRRRGDRISPSIAASAHGRFWHKADLARRLPVCPLLGVKRTFSTPRHEVCCLLLTHSGH